MRACTFVFLLLLFAQLTTGCNNSEDCDACRDLSLVKTAFENRERIQAFLDRKECTQWKDLTFNFIAITYDAVIDCLHVEDATLVVDQDARCDVAETLSLRIDQEISQVANTAVVDDLAREGQLECEPDGTMVFNRGRVIFSELDSLFEPVVFRPNAWEEEDLSVGFEVILTTQPVEENELCTRIESVFLVLFDILDSSGGSLVSVPY